MPRRTKIVATLGPASSDPKTLARMIDAGLDVVRMNFSHGTAAEHTKRVELVRSLARKAGRAVGVLVDLQGPKIRIGRFRDGKISLAVGAKFVGAPWMVTIPTNLVWLINDQYCLPCYPLKECASH